MTRPHDRSELIAWIGTKTEGANISEVVAFMGMCLPHVESVLRRQRKLGKLILIGKPPLCRWATPETAEAVTAWRLAHKAETDARQRERSRLKRSIYRRRPPKERNDEWEPHRVFVPATEFQALPVGPRWIFDMGATA